MKISDAIEMLTKIKEESGDLDLVCVTDIDNEAGCLIDFDMTFETIGIPSQMGDEEILAVAFIDSINFEPEPVDPTPTGRKSGMTIVK